MINWVFCIVSIGIFAYLCGSIPTGFWLGKALGGIDIRQHGSGSTGATNVFRTMGVLPALATLVIDVTKGFFAVAAAQWFATEAARASFGPWPALPDQTIYWIISMAAILALFGHARSPWIGLSGGKSAATGLGVLLAISWPVAVFVALIFAIMLAISRFVSLSSMAAAISAVVGMVVFDQPIAFLAMATGGAGYVIVRHRANIIRLISGTEPRINSPGTKTESKERD